MPMADFHLIKGSTSGHEFERVKGKFEMGDHQSIAIMITFDPTIYWCQHSSTQLFA